MSEEESAFYMAIEDPYDFRRELLGSSKGVIQLLQKHEELKQIRQEKIKLMHEFSNVNSEITMLMNKLKKAIPKTKLRNIPNKEPVSKKKESVINSKHHPELSNLQRELAEIENKLNGLN